jgi:hypothetical protein
LLKPPNLKSNSWLDITPGDGHVRRVPGCIVFESLYVKGRAIRNSAENGVFILIRSAMLSRVPTLAPVP